MYSIINTVLLPISWDKKKKKNHRRTEHTTLYEEIKMALEKMFIWIMNVHGLRDPPPGIDTSDTRDATFAGENRSRGGG